MADAGENQVSNHDPPTAPMRPSKSFCLWTADSLAKVMTSLHRLFLCAACSFVPPVITAASTCSSLRPAILLTNLRGRPVVLIGAFNNDWTIFLAGEEHDRRTGDPACGRQEAEADAGGPLRLDITPPKRSSAALRVGLRRQDRQSRNRVALRQIE